MKVATVWLPEALPSVAVTVNPPTGTTAWSMIVKIRAFDAPPPPAWLDTVTFAVPCSTKSALGMVACSCVPLTKLVGKAPPFQSMVEPVKKLIPLTVSVRAEPPSRAEVGLSVVRVGAAKAVVSVKLPDL